MAIEKDIKSFKKDKQRLAGVTTRGYVYSREEAYDLVVSKLSDYMTQNNITINVKNGSKEDFRKIKQQYYDIVEDLVYSERIVVREYKNNMAGFINYVVEEIVGYSVLADAFYDPQVTDIFCNAWNEIFIEKNGKMERYPHTFRSRKHFEAFIERVLRMDSKEINRGTNKIVSAVFFEDRLEAIIDPVAAKGISITFRKHSENHVTLNDLMRQGVLSADLAKMIGILILGQTNIAVGGITGSGKTTTLRALLNQFAKQRMLVIEDTPELFPEVENNLQLVSFKSDNPDEEVTLERLIYTALRLKPRYIAIGEVRGREMIGVVESGETGHSTIFTAHADSAVNLVNRMVTKYMMGMPNLSVDVVERLIGMAIDYVIIQDDIPGIGRKITSLTEVSYNFDERRVEYKPIYRFNFETNDFEQLNKLSPEKADKMLRRGVPLKILRPLVEGWDK